MDLVEDAWFMTRPQRGNAASDIDRQRGDGRVWTEGNLVVPLVHGATYFKRLFEELCALQGGDRVYLTDWRGDSDERLLKDGHTVGEVLCDLVKCGVDVRGLLWRSHSDRVSFSAGEPAVGGAVERCWR